MPGEISYFRKRFFGGFNRRDVIDYIEKLAQERNRLLAAKDRAESEASELNEENKVLRIQLAKAWMQGESYGRATPPATEEQP